MKKLCTFFMFVMLAAGISLQAQNQILVVLQDTTLGTATQIGLKKADNDSVKATFAQSGLAYDIIYRDPAAPTSFRNYKTLFLVETSFITPSFLPAAYRDSLKAFLNSGTASDQKSLIVFGGDFGYNYSRTGAPNIDTTLSHMMMKFVYVSDNGATTTDRKITGLAVRPGAMDSMAAGAANFYVDAVTMRPGGMALAKHQGRTAADSIAAVGFDGATYNTVIYFADPRYVVPVAGGGGGRNAMIAGAIGFIATAGGYTPVELTSFTANQSADIISLRWQTASETNNMGYEVERKSAAGDFEKIGFVAGRGTTAESSEYSYSDRPDAVGYYTYRLKQIDFDGTTVYSPEVEVDFTAPAVFSLGNNYPNPFNPATTINFTLAEQSMVTLSVYNAIGERVAVLVNGELPSGFHIAEFNASNLPSGIYIYRLEAGSFTATIFINLMY